MKEISKPKQQNTRSLSPDMIVSELIDLWPQTIDTFVKMGFAPITNKLLRKTIARYVTIRQAANFRNVDLNILLLNLETAITNPTAHNEAFINPDRLRFDENAIPDLQGDLTILGLIPCPLRNVLVEKFDAFVQENYTDKQNKVAWWFSAEGTGTNDVKNFIRSTAKAENFEKFPHIFKAVGTELFLNDEFCRKMYKDSIFKTTSINSLARPEFQKLEDPHRKLQLQFVLLLSFYCHRNEMKNIPLPETWFDLTNDIYRGKIVIPSLNLPIMPDFLSALYYYLGDSLFMKFCQNVSFALHPSQSATKNNKSNSPGIFITPIHFSKIMKVKDGVHIIPKDGFVTVPSYFSLTVSNKLTDTAVKYFLSEKYLETYYKLGSFIPNNKNIEVDLPLDKLICRPWESLLENIPDIFFKQLLRNFKLKVAK